MPPITRFYSHRRGGLLGLTFALAFAFGSVLAGCAAVPPAHFEEPEAQGLTLASTEWPPFTAIEGEPRVANHLVELALHADAITTEQIILPEAQWETSVITHEVDGSAAMWWSAERAEHLVFSQPYLENRLVLIGRAGSDVSATSFAQLVGKKVGIVEGYSYGEAVTSLDATTGPEWVPAANTPSNIRALLAGETDYVLADALYASYSLATHPENHDLLVGEHPLVLRTLHFAVHEDVPNARVIVDNFDARVRQMLRDGSYNKALGLDWIEADVDGDGDMEFVFAGEHAGTEPPRAGYRVATPEHKVEVETQPEYIINGQTYSNWDTVPDSFKVTGVGGSNVGLGIRW